MKRLILLAGFVLYAGIASAQPTIEWLILPQYVGGTGATTTFENPIAIIVRASGLQPNAVYGQLHVGFNHVSAPTTTRGSKWSGTAWISPSTFVNPWRSATAAGQLTTVLAVRTPSSYSMVDSSRARFRITRPSIDTVTFDSPFSIKSLEYSTTATGPNAGAVVYGYVDTAVQANGGKIILLYRNASDAQPLSAWYVIPGAPANQSDFYRTRMDTTNFRHGYFQLLVPANTSIGKIEVRDTNNTILRYQTGTAWRSGAPGTMTNLSAQAAILLNTLVEEVDDRIPSRFELKQNYPNPFNPSTRIEFNVPSQAHVSLQVYNLLGQHIVTLVNEELAPGVKAVAWNGRDASGRVAPSGIYFYRLVAGGFTQVNKMTLAK